MEDKMKKWIIVSTLVLILVSVFPPKSVHADMAPPLPPSGANIVPGEENTQVRMVAETVTLTVSEDPANDRKAISVTNAVFTMRNLGDTEEKMRARFPLSFFNGASDGYGNFPEIPSIHLKVDGKTVQTKRENQPLYNGDFPYAEREEIPWAVFDVTFPPGQDVTIDVTYSVNGQAMYPYEAFRYILETGAGWNGTISSADVIVRLPYEVNKANVWVEGVSGYSEPTQGGDLIGNEIRWHFDELEPTRENNIEVIVITPSLWKSVFREAATVEKNPSDGEAWGRLAKAYKEVASMPKGYLREDPAGREMFVLSKSAYEKCLALLPKDSLWQYGYADLLWPYYYFDIYLMGQEDTLGILPTILTSLQTALVLDPNNQQAKDLLTEISYAIPDAVSLEVDAGIFTLLGLTATPIPPTAYLIPTETPAASLTEIAPTQESLATPTESLSQPVAKNPLCGSAFILPGFLGMVFVFKKIK
jgi:hypothetical protein